MAKRRRLNRPLSADRGEDAQDADALRLPSGTLEGGVQALNLTAIAIGLLAATVVYVSYFPSDSVAVEQGDALWFTALALLTATVAWTLPWINPSIAWRRGDVSSMILDGAPWLLAAWMMLAAFATSPPGNLRMATNEAWFWVAAAGLFTGSRFLLGDLGVRRRMIGLLVVVGCGLSVHGLHQYFVSLPLNRAEYLRDPDGVLRQAMIDAPSGSAERMIFENRLMDGGPTATFALANSLAAVLLVTVLLASGVLVLGWRRLHPVHRMGWILAVALCAAGLMAARSRSATLAMLIAWGLLWIAANRVAFNPVAGHPRRLLGLGISGLLAISGCGVIVLAWFGNREWFEMAPASLSFRFQYWRSTWRMLLDHPWFGVGPGNFQAIYERYREPTATEQIAEPHNLVMETLAAGGFFGLGLLLVIGLALVANVWSRTGKPDAGETVGTESDEAPTRRRHELGKSGGGATERSQGGWVWAGAVVALGLVWLLSWIARQPPDLDASPFVLVAVALFGWLVVVSIDAVSSRDQDVMVATALLAIMIHLMVAGGWTVPGVAVVICVLSGMLVRVPLRAVKQPFKISGTVPLASGVALLAALWVFSLRPNQQQGLWMARAIDAQSRGQIERSHQALLQAVEADRWSNDAVMWLTDFYRWRLVVDGDEPTVRRRWDRAIAEARRRGGEAPAMYRMLGSQQLHVFQRLGDPRDLEAAAKTFAEALRWSPSNQWMFAQVAVIERARGDLEASVRHAQTAESLSLLGGNIERELSRQMVYIPKWLGVVADRGPQRLAADQLLAEPNDAFLRKSTP